MKKERTYNVMSRGKISMRKEWLEQLDILHKPILLAYNRENKCIIITEYNMKKAIDFIDKFDFEKDKTMVEENLKNKNYENVRKSSFIISTFKASSKLSPYAKDGINIKLILPKDWLVDMGVSSENRAVIVKFDDEAIDEELKIVKK